MIEETSLERNRIHDRHPQWQPFEGDRIALVSKATRPFGLVGRVADSAGYIQDSIFELFQCKHSPNKAGVLRPRGPGLRAGPGEGV